MKKLFVCLLFLLLAVPGRAEENIPLFKEYYYGMPKAEVQKTSGAIECQHENLIGSLCVTKPVSFGKQQWEQVFLIDQGKLVSVMLAKELDAQSLLSVIQTISSNDYALLGLSTGDRQFDVLSTAHEKGKKAILTDITKFEAESQNAPELVYAFYEMSKVKPMLKSVISLAELITKAPRDLRSVEVKRIGEIMSVQFIAPIAGMQDMQKTAKESRESF